MRFVFFYHSILSDWNHGNAHFLRGVAGELLERGHDVVVLEPSDAWSLENLVHDHGAAPIEEFRRRFPRLMPLRYRADRLDLDVVLSGADVVLVHEWSDHALVARIGEHRARIRSYRLFFHDTHHRAVSAPEELVEYELRHYDGVLAYGAVIRDLYLRRGWAANAWTWHEAADTRLFHPRPASEIDGDLVWVGNWGDDERTEELEEYLIGPADELGLRTRIHGVRYPPEALARLSNAGIEYGGWLPNWQVPDVFARFRVTVHVPRRPYVTALRGIPTIRPFEAMACGIPLVSSSWEDAEGLFRPGQDYLVARNGREMQRHLRDILADRSLAEALARNGIETIRERHTCGHRVDELLQIIDRVSGGAGADVRSAERSEAHTLPLADTALSLPERPPAKEMRR